MGSSVGLPERPELRGKKVKFSNIGREEQSKQEVNSSEIADPKWTGRLYWLHEPAKTEKQTYKFDSYNRKTLLAKLGKIVADEIA